MAAAAAVMAAVMTAAADKVMVDCFACVVLMRVRFSFRTEQAKPNTALLPSKCLYLSMCTTVRGWQTLAWRAVRCCVARLCIMQCSAWQALCLCCH